MHDKVKSRNRRDIPAVSKILDSLDENARSKLPRPLVVETVRQHLAKLRRDKKIPAADKIVDLIHAELEALRRARLCPVINGTGIIVHTNLGRSPLSAQAAEAVRQIASSYNNLELDVPSGDRGRRGEYVEHALAILCQAEAATVVNNCAAALVLIARHFISLTPIGGRRAVGAHTSDTTARVPPNQVIISRGELVQIGGGFRIGEILEASGAKLREVGATNKTTLSDYVRAIGKNTAFILRVHRSNFSMSGFTDSPSTKEIATVARKHRVPFVEDIGSGAIWSTEQLGLHDHEPTPNESLKSGADLICFSGDKLFGGPQAGIVAGKKRLISALKHEPIFRALRCDKLTFAALQTTVDLHLAQTIDEIPALALLQIPKDELRGRAANILTRLRGLPLKIAVGRGVAKVGGGSLPKSIVPSIAIDIWPENGSLEGFAATLRRFGVIGYIGNQRFKLDLRTIFAHQDDAVVDAIRMSAATPHHEVLEEHEDGI
jgi:L-seryl-tRNA(Ser) seleniumtransferase